jgi:hypothetical protein
MKHESFNDSDSIEVFTVKVSFLARERDREREFFLV